MPILLNDNLNISAPRPTDNRFGPYANTTAALAGVPAAQRYIGLTVGVLDAGNVVSEYWFDDGIANTDLVIKTLDLTPAYNQANGAYGQANAARDQANTASGTANDAYGQANSARDQANTGYGQANAARLQANTARDTANDAYLQANNAYAEANLKLNIAGGTITGSLNVANVLKANVLVSTSTNVVPPNLANTDGERLRLYDFNTAGRPNYAIGVEGNHVWMGVDDNGGSTGFKWYGNTTVAALLRTNGTFQLSNTVEAKVLRANGTGTAIDASQGNVLTNQVTGTQFNFLNGLYTTTVLANTSQTADYTFKLPSSGGTDGFVLSTDGTGNTVWSNSIYVLANTARDQANAARDQANSARDTANGAYSQANGAYAHANIVYGQANDAYSQANSARGQANAAYGQANLAYGQANAAYAEANLKLNIAGGTINGSLNVSGNLTITGNTLYQNVTTLNIADPLIYLASNNDTSDVVDIGFMAGKNTGGTYSHTGLVRDAGDGTWYLFDNLADEGHENNVIDFANTTLSVLRANIAANSILLTGNAVSTQANLTLAHDQANTARDTANGAYAQANGAYAQANTAANTVRVSANSGSTLSNKQVNFINTASIQVSVNDAGDGNANISFTTTGAAVADAYAQANAAYGQANDAYGQANSARNQANTAYGQANAAYAQANGAYSTANAKIETINGLGAITVSSGSTNNVVSYSVNVNVASTTVVGVTKLVDSITSTDTANAATANSAKWLNDVKVAKAGDTMTGALTITTSGTGLTVANANVTSHLTVGTLNVRTNTVTTSTTGQVVLDAFLTTAHASAKYFVQANSGTDFAVTEIILVQDGSNVFLTEYGTVQSGPVIGSFTADVDSGSVRLLFTPVNNINTIRSVRYGVLVP